VEAHHLLQVTQSLEQEALRLVRLTQEHERDAAQVLEDAIDNKKD
jgi:K+/H+ antiporter YhaU regulatory subunit KhtT